jgi:hypothetical protein
MEYPMWKPEKLPTIIIVGGIPIFIAQDHAGIARNMDVVIIISWRMC